MRLLLLRHAKAAALEKGDDHDRALTSRGLAEAAWAGARMVENGWIPTLALVSDARRTRETFDHATAPWPTPPRLVLQPDLYDADPETILQAVATVPDTTPCLLVIAHNPGLAATVLHLAIEASPPLRDRLAQGFPPAALAVVRLSGGVDAVRAGGVLEALLTPPSTTLGPSSA